jgi:hypothetical protein
MPTSADKRQTAIRARQPAPPDAEDLYFTLMVEFYDKVRWLSR